MKRLEDILNIDLPLPARFHTPTFTPLVLNDEGAAGEDDDDAVADEPADQDAELPGTIRFRNDDEESEAENLGDDFFGENAGLTGASGRKKFDEDEESGTGEEELDLDELDDDSEEEGESTEEGGEDLDEDEDFDDDDDDVDDDDDDFDDDE